MFQKLYGNKFILESNIYLRFVHIYQGKFLQIDQIETYNVNYTTFKKVIIYVFDKLSLSAFSWSYHENIIDHEIKCQRV